MTEQQPRIIDGERQLNMSAGKKRFIILFYGIVSTLAGIAFFPFITETMEPTGWGYTGAWQATTAFSFGTITGLAATVVVIAVASWLFARMVFTKWHLDYTYLMGTAGAFLAAILHTAAFIIITAVRAMTGAPMWSFTLIVEAALHVLLSGFIAGVFTTAILGWAFRHSWRKMLDHSPTPSNATFGYRADAPDAPSRTHSDTLTGTDQNPVGADAAPDPVQDSDEERVTGPQFRGISGPTTPTLASTASTHPAYASTPGYYDPRNPRDPRQPLRRVIPLKTRYLLALSFGILTEVFYQLYHAIAFMLHYSFKLDVDFFLWYWRELFRDGEQLQALLIRLLLCITVYWLLVFFWPRLDSFARQLIAGALTAGTVHAGIAANTLLHHRPDLEFLEALPTEPVLQELLPGLVIGLVAAFIVWKRINPEKSPDEALPPSQTGPSWPTHPGPGDKRP